MESTLIIISVISAILSIVMIVKFFQIAADVKKIRKSAYPDLSDANIISLRLSGKTDEMYLIIIRRMVVVYEELAEEYANLGIQQLPKNVADYLKKHISVAEYNMQLLGRKLPDELKSLEAYQSFRKIIRFKKVK